MVYESLISCDLLHIFSSALEQFINEKIGAAEITIRYVIFILMLLQRSEICGTPSPESSIQWNI